MTRWNMTVDIKAAWQQSKKGDITTEELVSTIVPKLTAAFCPYQLLEDLKVVADSKAFDVVWKKIYDWADATGVWIATF